MTAADKLVKDVNVRDLDGIIGKDEEFEEGEGAPNYGSLFGADAAIQKTYNDQPRQPCRYRQLRGYRLPTPEPARSFPLCRSKPRYSNDQRFLRSLVPYHR